SLALPGSEGPGCLWAKAGVVTAKQGRRALTRVRVHISKVAQRINNGFGFRNEAGAIKFVWRKWNFRSHDERSRTSDANPDAGSKCTNVQFIATVVDNFVRQCRASLRVRTFISQTRHSPCGEMNVS